MYTTSNEYKIANLQHHRQFESNISIGNRIITNDEVVSINLQQSMQQDATFTIGNTIASSLNITFLHGDIEASDRDIINLNIGLLVNGAYEYIPLGIYNIDICNSNDTTTIITAYDNMVKFDIPYVENNPNPTVHSVINRLIELTGIGFAGTLSNYTNYNLISLGSSYTCRDILGLVAGVLGCNAIIDREGKFKFVDISKTSNLTITTENYSDYFRQSKLYKISKIVNELEQSTIEIGTIDNDTVCLKLSNPYVNDEIIQDLYSKMNGFNFLPYEINWNGDLSLDLGDLITITDKKGNSFLQPILTQSFVYTGGLSSVIQAQGDTKLANTYITKSKEEADLDKAKDDINSSIEQLNDSWVATFNEGYNQGVTTINKNGVTVTASNVNSKTNMSANGFKIIKIDTGQEMFKVNSDGTLSFIGDITTYTGGSKSGYLGNNSVRFYNWLSTLKEEIAWLYAGITSDDKKLRGASLRGLEYLGLGLKGTGDYGENYIVLDSDGIAINKNINMNDYSINRLRCINYPNNRAVYMNNLWYHLNQVNTNNNLGFLVFNYNKGGDTTALSTVVQVSNGNNAGDYGELRCGDFKAYGTKNAYVQTSVGYVGINAYETSECYFGDVGETILDSEGYSYVYIDSIFKETISNNHKYQVFLTVYGEGTANVIERTPNYFVIKGTPNLEIGYEIKGKRKGYEDHRLQREYNSFVKGQDHGLDYDYQLEREEFNEELESVIDRNVQTLLENKELINLIEGEILNENID